MPSLSLGKRLKASKAEKWDVSVHVVGVEGLPEWVGVAAVQLRRASTGSSKRSSRRQQQSTADAEATGRKAAWGVTLGQEVTIYKRSDGQPLPKHYELVVRGWSQVQGGGGENKPRKVGTALVDLSTFSLDPPPSHAGQPFVLPLRPEGFIKVSISAQSMANMSCETSQLSCGSYLSEMSFDESCTQAVVQHCSRGTAQPTNPFDDSAACDSVVARGNVLEDSALDETAPGVEGRCHPFKSTTGQWEVGGGSGCHDEPVVTGSVSAADTAYFLRELASSESDESSHKPLPAKPNRRWSWLRGYKSTSETALASSPSGRSPADIRQHSRSPHMGHALKVAQAGPSPSPVTASQFESESDPETLRSLMRKLHADRQELAYKNWALDATNMCLNAELEEASLKLAQQHESLKAGRRQIGKLEAEVESLNARLLASKLLAGGTSEGAGDRLDELHQQLAIQKTNLAQAEFELIGVRQELRLSRRATEEKKIGSGRSSCCRSPAGADSTPKEAAPRDSGRTRRRMNHEDDYDDLQDAVCALHSALSLTDPSDPCSASDSTE